MSLHGAGKRHPRLLSGHRVVREIGSKAAATPGISTADSHRRHHVHPYQREADGRLVKHGGANTARGEARAGGKT